ncbi:hypothetical protein B566_EDAN015152 [Ephemera danica]|nr:hypothetical protein B566_EDAN015152 [Ephemera danica]
MVRNYKRSPGSRPYANFTQEKMQDALKDITNGMSYRQASKKYKINASTLANKLNGKHKSKTGGQTVLTQEEEKALVDCLVITAEWTLPLDINDLRYFTKALLDRKKRNVACFTQNLPGMDWAYSFIKRNHEKLGHRLATNTNLSRAKIGPDDINSYFDNLEVTLDGIPACNIINYDETNVTDDPGKTKVICKRGVKYVEIQRNHSKSSTSLMMAAAANGTLLPPYFIFKAKHLYDSWKNNGPRGARYSATPHGWIDSNTFVDWLQTIIVPYKERKADNTKDFVIIGDNLSSHLTAEAVKVCKENGIKLVFLPPNSTHLTQPLDVGFFRPFKGSWRWVLRLFKKSNPQIKIVPKDHIPSLVREALERMNEVGDVAKDIKSSFRATGIFPLDRHQILKRFPSESSGEEACSVLTEFLKEQRFGNPQAPARKRRRLSVQPGKSVCGEDESDTSESDVNSDRSIEDECEDVPTPPVVNTTNIMRAQQAEVSEDEHQESEDEHQVSDDGLCVSVDDIVVGAYFLVKFISEGRRVKEYQYVCTVQYVYEEEVQVMAYTSQNSANTVFLPKENDVSIVPFKHIMCCLPEPEILPRGDRYFYQFKNPIAVIEK